jgi:hypothetical protein
MFARTHRVLLLTIGKDDVDHADEHPVLCGVTGVLDDGNNVGPLLGHVDEITSTSVRELDGVYGSLGSDDIGNVRYRGTAEARECDRVENTSTTDSKQQRINRLTKRLRGKAPWHQA